MSTISDLYGPVAAGQLFGSVSPSTLGAVSGPVAGGSTGAAATWVLLLLLLVAFRIAWEFSPMAKE